MTLLVGAGVVGRRGGSLLLLAALRSHHLQGRQAGRCDASTRPNGWLACGDWVRLAHYGILRRHTV